MYRATGKRMRDMGLWQSLQEKETKKLGFGEDGVAGNRVATVMVEK
jgi:hypothetical protein